MCSRYKTKRMQKHETPILHPFMTLLCTTRPSLYTLFAPLLHTSRVLSTFKHHWATPLPRLCWPDTLVKARTHRSSRETSHHSPGWEECIAGPVSCTASTKEILAHTILGSKRFDLVPTYAFAAKPNFGMPLGHLSAFWWPEHVNQFGSQSTLATGWQL